MESNSEMQGVSIWDLSEYIEKGSYNMDGVKGRHIPSNYRVRKVEINPVPNVDTTEMDDRTEGEEIASERASVAFAKREIAEILKMSIPLGKVPEPCISGGRCSNQE